jgi:hypothetical protein
MRQKSNSTPASSETLVRNIRRATRKHHAAEEKIRIVLDGLRGETSIAELCRREGIAESIYYSWCAGLITSRIAMAEDRDAKDILLNEWPCWTEHLGIESGRPAPEAEIGPWLRCQPPIGRVTHPALRIAGTEQWTQPDGLYIRVGRRLRALFADCVALEVCTSSQNFQTAGPSSDRSQKGQKAQGGSGHVP